jgi:hypothetical protein
MTSLGGKLTALVCHLTKKVNKAEEPTYLFKNIALNTLHNDMLIKIIKSNLSQT